MALDRSSCLFQYCLCSITVSLFLALAPSTTCSAQNSPPPITMRPTELFPHLSFEQEFSVLFGGKNVQTYYKGAFANITLNKVSGSGLGSKKKYHYGFFSAAMKLPPGYTSGVVVAFYLSNQDTYPHNHDEVDFELLGHEKRKEWVLQTNMYGNGSVGTGREEKFRLWFDPTTQYHQYSILWNDHHVVFLIDNIPVREVIHTAAISPVYPSKPMSVYATIWDASDWATDGGKSPVDYNYAPFTASLAAFEAAGCIYNPGDDRTASRTCPRPPTNKTTTNNPSSSAADPVSGPAFVKLSQEQANGLRWARNRFLIYSYCKDIKRYKALPPECKQTN